MNSGNRGAFATREAPHFVERVHVVDDASDVQRDMPRIGPQDGPQTLASQTAADIAIYGGQAGGGKTFWLLMEAARFTNVPGYGGVVFRESYKDIRNEGGLLDESFELYPGLGATLVESRLEWVFPVHECKVSFSYMQSDGDLTGWMGSQLAFIGWDELTHFSKRMFFYMLSRLRTSCGIMPYVRATCNPDPDSWVAEFIAWWIDPVSGFPIPERAGVLRYFVRVGDDVKWADDAASLQIYCGDGQRPLSVTFIGASLDDNKKLLAKNPSYKSNLAALATVERERLAKGNWKIRRGKGDFFRKEWFGAIVEHKDVPKFERMVRYWDRAATEPSEKNPDPDWTVGVLMGRTQSGVSYVVDVVRMRGTPGAVEACIKATAENEPGVGQVQEQDPGAAGKAEVYHLQRNLPGLPIMSATVGGAKKCVRWVPVSSASEKHLVKIVRGAWNSDFLDQLESVGPDDKEYAHDDDADALAGAHRSLLSSNPRLRTL